jgi:DNA-binding protein HU-beta
MAKSMTKAEIVDAMAKKTGLTKKAVRDFFDEFAQLAYKQAKNDFAIPGIGKLVVAKRKARKGRNPATGEAIKIPAGKVVKFRVAKAAKDAIAPKKK